MYKFRDYRKVSTFVSAIGNLYLCFETDHFKNDCDEVEFGHYLKERGKYNSKYAWPYQLCFDAWTIPLDAISISVCESSENSFGFSGIGFTVFGFPSEVNMSKMPKNDVNFFSDLKCGLFHFF
jgi:hypothetical protein